MPEKIMFTPWSAESCTILALFSTKNRQLWHFLGKYQSKLMINNHKLCQSAFNRQFKQFTLLLRCQKLKDCKFLEYYAKLFNIAVSDKNLVKLRYQQPFLFDSHLVFWQISLTQGHWLRTKTTKLLHNFQFILCQKSVLPDLLYSQGGQRKLLGFERIEVSGPWLKVYIPIIIEIKHKISEIVSVLFFLLIKKCLRSNLLPTVLQFDLLSASIFVSVVRSRNDLFVVKEALGSNDFCQLL